MMRGKMSSGMIDRALLPAFSVVILLTGLLQPLPAQEGTWTFSASVGFATLELTAVDEDNRSDVEGFNEVGIPIGAFPLLSGSPFFNAKLHYRLDREFGASLRVQYFSKEVSTRFEHPDEFLHLTRSVGATDVAGALVYYPQLQAYGFEWYIELNIALTFARAQAVANGEKNFKIDGQTSFVKTFDSDGNYKKSKLGVGIGTGATIPVTGPWFLRGEVSYKFAQMGAMNGTVRRFDSTSPQETTIAFNYSGFLLSAGVGIEL
ncbi:MAG: hypothetical protein WEE20_09680 [Bacteroidota bacterium]